MSPDAVTFGSVPIGQTASTKVSLLNEGSAPIQITDLNLTGQPFSVVNPTNLPVTIAAGGAYSVNVSFNPAAVGTSTGELLIASSASSMKKPSIKLSGTGTTGAGSASLSALSCSGGTFTGSGTDACTVTLTASAPGNGLTVNLSSSSSAVAVPSIVTVPKGATSAVFTATVSPVAAAEAVTLTASEGSVSRTFALQLNAAVPSLSISATSLAFGSVLVNTTAAPQPVTLTSTGTAPVTISAAAVTGAGFAASGGTFPMTLNPGQQAKLYIQFNPLAVGAATGQLSITSNSSTNGTAVISLSGIGTAAPAALSALYCSSGTMTGSGTDACTVTLTAAAPSGGLSLILSSSSSAVTVPSTVTVPANAISAGFTATVASVATAQAVTMTASVGGVSKNFVLQLNAAILALSINATNVAFGDVVVNTSATQPLILTSTGTAAVTVNGATLTGAGFKLSGSVFPATLNPGQQATLYVQFNPLVAGAATGQLTITSNSSTNGTAVIGLTGTGTAAPQVVAVAVTPATASINTGVTQQFAASVTGTSNTAVTWTASGTGCSGATCGTISSTGLYTAPPTVPSPATVTITATSASDPSKSASATVTIMPPTGTTYYLAPAANGGNDSNNGLSPGAPWRTPNHSVNCGDVIIAASGTYPLGNFGYTFGPVTGSGHCFAFLKCAAFDSCLVNGTGGSGNDGIFVSQSHWAVMGFEVTNPSTTSGNAACFKATTLNAATITDVAFINDIANGCGANGFGSNPYYLGGNYGVDYVILIADIAYDAAQSNDQCHSGISIFQPANYDTLPGTHMYVSQVFAWGNTDPSPCAGTAPTDGEGIIFDTWDALSYTGQGVAENNIVLWNGATGIRVDNTTASKVYLTSNTSASNNASPAYNLSWAGELATQGASNVELSNNIARTYGATCCTGYSNWAFFASTPYTLTQLNGNFLYSAAGHNIGSSDGNFGSGVNNITGIDPAFTALPASLPAAPNCGSSSSVISCMAPLIAQMKAAAAGTTGYGYQPPSSTAVNDPLFPQWLCQYSGQLSGLVTLGCSTGSATQ